MYLLRMLVGLACPSNCGHLDGGAARETGLFVPVAEEGGVRITHRPDAPQGVGKAASSTLKSPIPHMLSRSSHTQQQS